MILGEDVGPRGGVFRATDGLAEEFGQARVARHPAGRELDHRDRDRPGPGRPAADRRDPVRRLHPLRASTSSCPRRPASTTASNGDFAVPLVVRAPWGGGVHGALYHSQSIEATYAHIPGLKVVVPSTPADVCGMLRTAVDDADPVLFLEHKKTYRLITGLVPDDDAWRVPIGLAEVAREGDDLTVVTYGLHRHLCLEAAEAVADERRRVGRGDRPAHHQPARPRHGAGLGRQDRALPRRPRGQHQLRRRAPRSRPSSPRRPSGTSTPRCAGSPPPTCRATRSPAPSRPSCSSTPPRSSRRCARASGSSAQPS